MATFQDYFNTIAGGGTDSFDDPGAFLDSLDAQYGQSGLGNDVAPWMDFDGASVKPLDGVQVGAPPTLDTDPSRWMELIDQTAGDIGSAYNFDTRMADTERIAAPQAALSQFATSPELQSFLSGEGFSPAQLALMQTQAREAPARAGQQQLGQMRRILGEAGISGPAAAGMMGDVARNTGYAQNQNLQNVALQNAQQGTANKTFGIGQQTQIGLTNMQQANMMAVQNANMMFEALRANQNAQNSMNQFNTNNQQQQQMQSAGAQANYRTQAGTQLQGDLSARQFENANKQFGTQLKQADYDWQTQLLPWQEMNNRYGQAAATLGSWGQ